MTVPCIYTQQLALYAQAAVHALANLVFRPCPSAGLVRLGPRLMGYTPSVLLLPSSEATREVYGSNT